MSTKRHGFFFFFSPQAWGENISNQRDLLGAKHNIGRRKKSTNGNSNFTLVSKIHNGDQEAILEQNIVKLKRLLLL